MAQKLMYEDKELLQTKSIINDSNLKSGRKTLSSTKISSLLSQQTAIDDSVVSDSTEWSSSKIDSFVTENIDSAMSGTYNSTAQTYTIKGAVSKIIINGNTIEV